jgi:hypothetical protein
MWEPSFRFPLTGLLHLREEPFKAVRQARVRGNLNLRQPLGFSRQFVNGRRVLEREVSNRKPAYRLRGKWLFQLMIRANVEIEKGNFAGVAATIKAFLAATILSMSRRRLASR